MAAWADNLVPLAIIKWPDHESGRTGVTLSKESPSFSWVPAIAIINQTGNSKPPHFPTLVSEGFSLSLFIAFVTTAWMH